MSKILIITGPTASGKSALAVELAQKYNGEIINGDSVAVYKELNIGSAKPTLEEQGGVPHHLLDYVDVSEDYSVARFQKDCRQAVEDILSRGKLPVITGGTGLYIKAVLYDYEFKPSDEEKAEDYSVFTNAELHRMLEEIDPASAATIHPNNRKRVIRALQIASSGTSKSEIEAGQQHQPVYDILIVGLTMDREKLRERIDRRVDAMIEAGLVDEVTQLYERYSFDLHCFTAIGYKEFREYLQGSQSLQQTVELIKTHTRQFAKRQYTWFNHQLSVNWFDIEDSEYRKKIEERTEAFLNE
ncbi:MAG: tRNA (adenosine(37)-N6)-dimethylallyltransferase MiaA [Erysipelotrichaceae bacterium]|nr:tRNA (adenosine(37)-N6)-dimethylallyltransferase MiaA [Erysipelotrichaceae bacterium]